MPIDIRFTAHSPRAGFASERLAQGDDPTAIRTAGRWASEQNFKIYIDIFSAAHISSLVNLAGHRDSMLYCFTNFDKYFPQGVFALCDVHGSQGARKTSSNRQDGASHDDNAKDGRQGNETPSPF